MLLPHDFGLIESSELGLQSPFPYRDTLQLSENSFVGQFLSVVDETEIQRCSLCPGTLSVLLYMIKKIVHGYLTAF